MKIYPSDHAIRQIEKPEFMDIPIGHLEHKIVPESITVKRTDNFAFDISKDINPYDSVENDSQIFFNDSGAKIAASIKRENNNYYYLPESQTEFVPETFEVSAVIQKKLKYNSGSFYNMKIGVDTLTWAKKLISAFTAFPANIKVNNGSSQPTSLIASDYSSLDFIFVQTTDGNAVNNVYLDTETILSAHANLWITVSEPDGIFKKLDAIPKYSFASPQIYNQSFNATTPYVADSDYRFSYYPDTKYRYKRLFTNQSPFYILERPNKGYIIISPMKFFDNLSANAKLIYETLFQIYAISYLETAALSSWVTNEPIDYIGTVANKFKRNHRKLNLLDMISKSNFGCPIPAGQFTLMNFNARGDAAVTFSEVDSDYNLFFRKVLRTDPEKLSEEISIYTTKNTVMFYKKEPIKQIETKASIAASIEEDPQCLGSYRYYITVGPIKSTKYRIHTTQEKTFEIIEPTRLHYLVALPTTTASEQESNLLLLDEYEYAPDAGVLIAEIKVIYITEAEAVDVRQLGGGAPPEKIYDDYELLDIGSLKGRPYRIGGTMIIKLPSRLKKYNGYIQEAVNKRMIASDLAMIIYQ